MALTSHIPKLTGRVLDTRYPNNHFCCNLNYLTVEPSQYKKVTSWDGAKTILIDFTTGAVMDSAEYLNRLFNKTDAIGTIYGYLNQINLNEVWELITNSDYHIKGNI